MKNLIYPDICFICKKIFEKRPFAAEKKFPISFDQVFCDILCPKCLDKIFFVSNEKSDLRFEKKYLNLVHSSFMYRDSIVDIIHMLKYNEQTFISEKISWFVLQSYLEIYTEEFPKLVLFVPMHKKAMTKRGFNQTYLICIHAFRLAKKMNIFFPEIDKNILVKVKNTKSQTKYKDIERRKNIQGAFQVKNPLAVEGKKILIIDDVCTTGSTLEECAKTILSCGADSVDAITFARAL